MNCRMFWRLSSTRCVEYSPQAYRRHQSRPVWQRWHQEAWKNVKAVRKPPWKSSLQSQSNDSRSKVWLEAGLPAIVRHSETAYVVGRRGNGTNSQHPETSARSGLDSRAADAEASWSGCTSWRHATSIHNTRATGSQREAIRIRRQSGQARAELLNHLNSNKRSK